LQPHFFIGFEKGRTLGRYSNDIGVSYVFHYSSFRFMG